MNPQHLPQWNWATRWEMRLRALWRLVGAASALVLTLWFFSPPVAAQPTAQDPRLHRVSFEIR